MKTYQVASYRYVVDLAQGGLAHLELRDLSGAKVGELSALAEGQKLPAPRISPDQSSAIAFIHESAMKQMLTLLREEKSVVLRIDGVAPGYFTLESSRQVLSTRDGRASQE
jgi:hypothetical protein